MSASNSDGEVRVITSPKASVVELPSRGIIAVDMDDVLCQTNRTIVDMHNEIWKTDPPLVLSDFENYLYWLNRGWGNPQETVAMVQKLYTSDLFPRTPPVPGAKEGLQRLKDMGYTLIIITARSESIREVTEDWLAIHLPDLIDEIHFTGAFQHLEPTREETEGVAARRVAVSHKKRSKAEVIHQTGALCLIDDSAENAFEVSQATPPGKVILFGAYPWNAVVHDPEQLSAEDKMTYVERKEAGILDQMAERRKDKIREGWLPSNVTRCADWEGVVRWVDKEFGQL